MGACAKQMAQSPAFMGIVCRAEVACLSVFKFMRFDILSLELKYKAKQLQGSPLTFLPNDTFIIGTPSLQYTHQKNLSSASKQVKAVKQVKIPMTDNVLKFECAFYL